MRKRILKVISILIASFLVLIGYYFLSTNYNITIPCLFHLITGFYCPGCGTTRLVFALLNGHVSEAYNYNRLFFILLPFIVMYGVYKIYIYILDKEDKIICKIPNVLIYMLLFIVMMFGVLRNIDNFSYLSP